jgi:CrcB protein
MAPITRLFLTAGVCGGFTTFSTFSLETLNLMRDGEWAKAGTNAIGSMTLCLIGVWLGHIFGTMLNERIHTHL